MQYGQIKHPIKVEVKFYRVTDEGNSSYTYGLKEFDKTEMEIINSAKSIEEINNWNSYNQTTNTNALPLLAITIRTL